MVLRQRVVASHRRRGDPARSTGSLFRLPDRPVLLLRLVYVSGGRRGLDVGLVPADLIRLCDAQVGAIGKSTT